VSGAGSTTSDSIPAWLSNGEHVWSAAEVDGAGGQGAVAALRRAAREGGLRFADGGAVGRNEKLTAPPIGRSFTYVDNSTTYYPQAQPKAVEINEKLQHAAALDSLS
jgi:hypothetical protein